MFLSRFVFFFFKQKTAYEISACLVGSEMCIRDRPEGGVSGDHQPVPVDVGDHGPEEGEELLRDAGYRVPDGGGLELGLMMV